MAQPKQGLTPKEVLAISMALSMMIEDIESTASNPAIPFTPQARKDFKDMLLNAKAAKAKIDLTYGHDVVIAPYVDGDENEFLTKQS